MCDQQSLRPACAYAQSDQSLCYSLEYSMVVKLQTEHHLEFLCRKGYCTGSSEPTLVKMPHCLKSHITAQSIFVVCNHIAKEEGAGCFTLCSCFCVAVSVLCLFLVVPRVGHRSKIVELTSYSNLGRDTRKPVFRMSDIAIFKPACSATETS